MCKYCDKEFKSSNICSMSYDIRFASLDVSTNLLIEPNFSNINTCLSVNYDDRKVSLNEQSFTIKYCPFCGRKLK